MRKVFEVKHLTAGILVSMSLSLMPDCRLTAQSASPHTRKAPGTPSKATLKGNWTGYYRWAQDDAKQNFELDQVALTLEDSGGQFTGQLIVLSADGIAWQQPVSSSLDPDGSVELFFEATSYDTASGAKNVMAKVLRGKLISGGEAIEGKVDMDRGREFRLNRTQQPDQSLKEKLEAYHQGVVDAKESIGAVLRQRLMLLVGTWKFENDWADSQRGHCGQTGSQTVTISLQGGNTNIISGSVNNLYVNGITRDDTTNGTCTVGHKMTRVVYRQTGDVQVQCPDTDACLMRTNISQCNGEFCEEKMWRQEVVVCKLPSSQQTPESFTLDCVWSSMYNLTGPNGAVFRKQ